MRCRYPVHLCVALHAARLSRSGNGAAICPAIEVALQGHLADEVVRAEVVDDLGSICDDLAVSQEGTNEHRVAERHTPKLKGGHGAGVSKFTCTGSVSRCEAVVSRRWGPRRTRKLLRHSNKGSLTLLTSLFPLYLQFDERLPKPHSTTTRKLTMMALRAAWPCVMTPLFILYMNCPRAYAAGSAKGKKAPCQIAGEQNKKQMIGCIGGALKQSIKSWAVTRPSASSPGLGWKRTRVAEKRVDTTRQTPVVLELVQVSTVFESGGIVCVASKDAICNNQTVGQHDHAGVEAVKLLVARVALVLRHVEVDARSSSRRTTPSEGTIGKADEIVEGASAQCLVDRLGKLRKAGGPHHEGLDTVAPTSVDVAQHVVEGGREDRNLEMEFRDEVLRVDAKSGGSESGGQCNGSESGGQCNVERVWPQQGMVCVATV